ncbi:hypothetical protein JOM56_002671 [Amanita muscaria]
MKTVLALHGYTQNANIFSKRLGALRKECGKDIELGCPVVSADHARLLIRRDD